MRRKRRNGYPGQKVLLVFILYYRRSLRGRGIFRDRYCSFTHSESCSAYGRRIAFSAPGLLRACLLIFNRLNLCGRVSLYLHEDRPVWSEYFDDFNPRDVIALLKQRGEKSETILVVLQAARIIAAWRRGRGEANEPESRTRRKYRTIPRKAQEKRIRPVLRRGVLFRSLAKRFYRKLFVFAIVLVGILSGPGFSTPLLRVLFAGAAGVVLLGLGRLVYVYVKTKLRLNRIIVANRFMPPLEY